MRRPEEKIVGNDVVWKFNLGSWQAGRGYSLHVINGFSYRGGREREINLTQPWPVAHSV